MFFFLWLGALLLKPCCFLEGGIKEDEGQIQFGCELCQFNSVVFCVCLADTIDYIITTNGTMIILSSRLACVLCQLICRFQSPFPHLREKSTSVDDTKRNIKLINWIPMLLPLWLAPSPPSQFVKYNQI